MRSALEHLPSRILALVVLALVTPVVRVMDWHARRAEQRRWGDG